MSHTFQATISEGQSFDLSVEDAQSLNVVKDANGDFHLLKDGQAFQAKMVSGNKNSKQYIIEINGNSYPILLADEYDLLVKKMGLKIGGEQRVSDVKAPMPGLVLEVSVSAGDEVAKGDALLILEAMKMENVLKSPGDGVVKNISIKKGDAVDKGQLLIEME